MIADHMVFEKKQHGGQITRTQKKKNTGKHSGPFKDELRKLMYGYGDDRTPNEQSVDLLEIYVEEFICNLVSRSMRRRQRHGDNSIKVADVLEVLKKDEKKYLRMPYILTTAKEFGIIKSDVEGKNTRSGFIQGGMNLDRLV